MVVASLAIGGVVGVLLSAGFVWLEIGRFATPQVPVTVFDERKLLAAYTVGLFVGVPLAGSYLLFGVSLGNGALPGTVLFLGGLVVGTEVAQRVARRSRYWGAEAAVPFYLLALRAGVGGILALAVVTAYLSGPTIDGLGIAGAALTAVAVTALSVAGALLSYGGRGPTIPRGGGPVAGALFGAVAFFLLGLGPIAGPVGEIGAPLVVVAGATLAYRGRRVVLAEVPPPTAAPLPAHETPTAYGRTAPAGTEGPLESERPP